jgi:hypothetical protein
MPSTSEPNQPLQPPPINPITPFRRPFYEIPRVRVKTDFNHGEAFALMKYETKGGAHVEWLWNSRDGVTPFGIEAHPEYCSQVKLELIHGDFLDEGSKEYQEDYLLAVEMHHTDFWLDRCLPFYRPSNGERVFVDFSEPRARAHYVGFVEQNWLSDVDAAGIRQHLDQLESEHAQFFQAVEAETKAWIESLKHPVVGQNQPEPQKYNSAGMALLEQRSRLGAKLQLRESFADKQAAVDALVQQSLSQPGEPTVIMGAEYNLGDDMAIAEDTAISLVKQFRSFTDPETDADVVRIIEARQGIAKQYDDLRTRFANAVMERQKLLSARGALLSSESAPLYRQQTGRGESQNPRRG